MFLCVSTNQLTIPTYSFSLASVNMHQIKGKKIGKQLGSKSASRFLDPSDSLIFGPPRPPPLPEPPPPSTVPVFNSSATFRNNLSVQHGSQIISSESGTFNSVISCRFNPIWRKDRYEFFLGSAISSLELANRTPRPPGSMSINYAHGHHVAKFSNFLSGIPDTGSAELFPSPPHRSRSTNFVQLPSATQKLSSRPLSQGTRQSSRAQHHGSTTTSTALSQRDMSMEFRVNAQLGQFQSQQALITSQMAYIMTTLADLKHAARSANTAQDKEDVSGNTPTL